MHERPGLLESLDRADPAQIGPFVLLGRLGSGSMGRVFLGRSAAGRLVAVKTIRLDLTHDADFRTRFALEVAAARRVSGVFTAAVVAADSEAVVPWLATAYVPAPSLERLVEAQGALPVPAVRWLAAGCAEALDSIHSAGLVHRDLKPSNVLVSLDGPRVIDFGLARAAERIQMTVSRVAVGTPAYMAPEQAEGSRHVTTASDVYSLGSTLLFAATGHGPYQGETVLEMMSRLATQPPDLSGLPPELFEIVRSCLDRDPAARPTPSEVLATVSPEVDLHAGTEPGLAYLPEPALAMVEDFRYGPRLPVDQVTGSGPVEEPVGAPPDEPAAKPGLLTRLRSLSAVFAAVALIGVGVLAGQIAGRGSNGRADDQEGGQSAPGFRGPPPGEPPPPLSGATDRPTGDPKIVVNQPQGDRHTVFVVHGTGWTPGEAVTVSLDHGRSSPSRPVADRKGTFNYAINQAWEFVPGPLSLGQHRVTASAAGKGRMAEAQFLIVP